MLGGAAAALCHEYIFSEQRDVTVSCILLSTTSTISIIYDIYNIYYLQYLLSTISTLQVTVAKLAVDGDSDTEEFCPRSVLAGNTPLQPYVQYGVIKPGINPAK